MRSSGRSADVALHQGIMMDSFSINLFAHVCFPLLSPEKCVSVCAWVCVCAGCIKAAITAGKIIQAPLVIFHQHAIYQLNDCWYRHEERERKAASHVSWWKRLTHATPTHTSDGETQNGPEHEQLAQEAAEDVEAGPAGMPSVP